VWAYLLAEPAERSELLADDAVAEPGGTVAAGAR